MLRRRQFSTWAGRESRHPRPKRRRQIHFDPTDQRRRTSQPQAASGAACGSPGPWHSAAPSRAHLTGLDNLKFVCRVYGVDYKPLVPFVEEFTELGVYFREPVLHYSNGMLTRLAFALSMAIEFDCFLIDEAMVVGDVRFHERCHVELFHKRKDRAFILVTHDANRSSNCIAKMPASCTKVIFCLSQASTRLTISTRPRWPNGPNRSSCSP